MLFNIINNIIVEKKLIKSLKSLYYNLLVYILLYFKFYFLYVLNVIHCKLFLCYIITNKNVIYYTINLYM